MCGEKFERQLLPLPLRGSPPRVRGEVDALVNRIALMRITPACAGRSLAQPVEVNCAVDHPRVCGEKPVVNPRFQSGRGSPPRVRGEGCCGRLFLELLGITPACAGRRRRSAGPCAVPGDHPRVCGEKSRVDRFRQAQPGSPPRVRGEAQLTFTNVAVDGITPACAGRRYRVYKTSRRAWDHPRVCGEKGLCGGTGNSQQGSPPRVRGEERAEGHHGAVHGITPACAGRSLLPHVGDRLEKDHPRVCGEKEHGGGRMTRVAGSPPRVRGEEDRRHIDHEHDWITPACAGRRNAVP